MTSEQPSPVPPEEFRDVLGSFASGVTVLTVRDEDDDIGITTSAFSSVSLDPPLVLVAVLSSSYLVEVLERQPLWTISVLSRQQEHVASRFAAAGRPSARHLLADLLHHRDPSTSALVVDGGVAAFSCQTHAQFPGGDHTMVMGRMIAVRYRSDLPPLLHFRGRYGGVATRGTD